MKYKVLITRSLDRIGQLVYNIKCGMESKTITAENAYKTILQLTEMIDEVKEKINLEDER